MSGSEKQRLRAEIARLEQELSKKDETIGRLTAPKKPGLGIKEYNIDITIKDILVQIHDSAEPISNMLAKAHRETPGFKVSQTVKLKMKKIVSSAIKKGEKEEAIYQDIWLTTKPETVMNNSEIPSAIEYTGIMIFIRLENLIANGSNWTVEKILKHKVTTVPYNPLGSVPKPKGKSTVVPNSKVSGSSYLELPDALNHPRKGLINIKNEDDNKCFLWCHVRHLREDEYHPGRISEKDREIFGKLIKGKIYKGIKSPIKLGDIPKIEKRSGIKVNVLGYDRGKFFPLYLGNPDKVDMGVMNLLLISDGEVNHYVLIKDMSALLYNINKHKGKKHFCMYCLQAFSTEQVLEEHTKDCITINGAQATELPKKGSMIKFTSHHKMLSVPFVIYADLESVHKKCWEPKKHPRERTEDCYFDKHECCSFGYKVVCSYDSKLSKPYVTYRGKNAIEKFLSAMVEEEKWCQQMMRTHFNKPLEMSKEDEILFDEQSVCHICQNEIDDNEIKVRDHCHYSGKFRGAAHQKCNSLYRLTKFIPVVFHNLGGYDAHFLVQKMSSVCKNRRIGVIPKSMEKYMMISWGRLKFIDSYLFMDSPLDSLVVNLPPEVFANTDSEFKNTRQRMLVRRKGVYPHEYFDTTDKFNDKCLPKKEAFASTLNMKTITDKEYEHAKNVWKTFGMKTLGDYHDLYLKCDVTLLADVFQEFRRVCMSIYELDPAHYVSSPGLSWDAMLKLTDINLELISDSEQYQMIEKGMRGGVSCISHRYARANNPDVPGYKKSEDNSYIVYLDFNGMYSWAMSQPLPVGGFRFMSKDEISEFDINSITDDSDKGYFLEVDLEIDPEFHDAMNDYPPCPEKMEITQDMTSPYCGKVKRLTRSKRQFSRAIMKEIENDRETKKPKKFPRTKEEIERHREEIAFMRYSIEEGIVPVREFDIPDEPSDDEEKTKETCETKSVEKLVTTLYDKEKYTVHHKNLQLYMSLGVKLNKIHSILEFDQESFMRDYIKLNTDLRAKATNAFEKNFFKKMNNSIYGKTCENLCKRIDVRLVNNRKQLAKMTSKPTFAGIRLFSDDLAAVHRVKQRLLLNKPSYIGCAILEISKTLIYDFHYNWARKRYGNNAKLLFTDTDSLMYHVKTDNVYKDMRKDKDRFDFSNYSKDSKYYSTENKGVTSKMKDECTGRIVHEFVGLRSKMYSYLVAGEENKKAKGVKKGVVEKHITHDDFLKTLNSGIQMRHKYKTILSRNHDVGTYEEEKVSLSSYDDKRFIFDDGISSVSHGHWGLTVKDNADSLKEFREALGY